MSSANQSLSFTPDNLPSAEGLRFSVVVADWNAEITHALLEGTLSSLKKSGVKENAIQITHVPGSFELTAGASMAIHTQQPHAVICLGCVIQGETRHFDFICQGVAIGLTTLTVHYRVPVIFGVLTTDNLEQAKERSGGKYGNKGVEAAITALQMAHLYSLHQFSKP
jgi:6,7-dimethyl-8-ribityllumazine synthase